MPNIDERALPGVGVCHEFVLAEGQRIGVLTHRTGRREILVYGYGDDPDAARPILTLEPEEAATLAQLLGAPRVNEKLAAMQRIEGLAIDWLLVPPEWQARTIADLQIRTRTGASLVAVMHASGEAIPGPEPTTTISPGDTVIAVGTEAAIDRLRVLLHDA